MFRKVYLSDLSSLIKIYKKTNRTMADQQLTVHFGLPLSVATSDNEIIGFASAAINESDEMKLSSYGVKVLEDPYIGNRLEEQAESILHSTFENMGEDYSPLKHSINQLVGWLNKCSV